jgi:hypothetical protein
MKSLRTLLAASALAVAAIATTSAAQASPSSLIYPGYCFGYQTVVTHIGPVWRSHFDRVDVYKKVRIGYFCARIKVYSYYKFHYVPFGPFYSRSAS